MKTIHPEELQALAREQDVQVIDVRTPAEYGEMHAEIAHLIPLDTLDAERFLETHEGAPVYVFCRTGSRAKLACQKLERAGHENAVVVEGGVTAWEQAGLPVVRGKRAISLERQVRIVAGALVLLGTTVGLLIHPAFLAVPAFVGAGLIFAGVTDWCGMALLLAKLPWNRGGGAPGAQASCALK